MTVAVEAAPVPRGWSVAMAAAGPVAIGGVLAARTHDASPMLAAPAIVFGVVAATAPALYIAMAAAGHAPPLAAVVRAFGVALGAFGVALAGLILPVAFAAASSVSPSTTVTATTAAVAAAGYLGLRRLASELRTGRVLPPGVALAGSVVFAIWAIATATIAGRLWWDLAIEVAS